MEKKHMTTREKLDLMKEINERNEQRRKEFAEKKKQDINKELFDMLVNGEITREEFERMFKK